MKLQHLTIAIFILLIMPLRSEAQNNDEKQVAFIRELYSSAMNMLQMKADPEYPAKDKMVISIDEMWPGSGEHKGTLELFYGLDLDHETSELQRFPHFARYKYNIGSMNLYYEILYHDPDDGNKDSCKPVFFYTKVSDFNGKQHECRYYFWNNKLIKKISSGSSEYFASEQVALERAKFISSLIGMQDLWNY